MRRSIPDVVRLVMVCLLSCAFAQSAVAQSASPTATGQTIRSATRAEYHQQLVDHYQFEPAQRTGGIYVGSIVGEFRTLNPMVANDETSFTAVSRVYDTLVGSSPINGEPAPNGLADWWEIAPDGVTYTFHLNPQATWHDGVDFTAADVAFSFDAMADEKTGSAYTGSFYDDVASYREVDPDTFELTSNGVLADLLTDLFVPIMPKHLWDAVPHEQWASDPGSTGQDLSRVVGTGAFKITDWQQGESITYVRNDDYYDTVPIIDGVVLRSFPDTEAAVNALIAGEVDTADIPPTAVDAIRQTAGLRYESYPTLGFAFYAYNLDPTKTTLFQDKQVRQALFYALDREAMAQYITLGSAEVPQGLQSSMSAAYAPDQLTSHYTYDPTKARQLLADAGWIDTDDDGVVDRNGESLRFEMPYAAGDAQIEQAAAYMQDAWKAIGVAMTPTPIDFNVLLEKLSVTFDFQIVLGGLGVSVDGNFYRMMDCDQYMVGFNMTHYCNPLVDDLNNRARHELDPAKRRALLIEAENLLLEDLPVAILLYFKSSFAYADRLHNYFSGTFGGPGLSYIWIDG